MNIPRATWPLDFPPVILHSTVARRDSHPDYMTAKSGDTDAAVRVVCSLLSQEAVAAIERQLAGRRPVIVPVRAIETTGINFLPDALAKELAQRLALDRTVDILQTNTVGHTRASGFHRLAFQPTFAGKLTAGEEYLLVDDHVGLGGTLANLRGYIESERGRVILATTLTASRRSEVLALRPATVQSLRDKHGEPLERDWREQFGFGLDALTEAEAGYLLRTPSVDAIRARMAEARVQGVLGGV